MPITPHESIAGHRFSYNRLRASRGRGLEPGPFESPLRARLARPCPAHAVPRSSPLFAPRPRSTWVSLRTARQVVKPNVEELRARPARKDHLSGAGARDAGRPDPQLLVRGCVDVRAHTREAREPRAYRSCTPLPPALPSSSSSALHLPLRTTTEPIQSVSDPTNFGLVFRSPRTLRVFGDLMSNISATRGRPDMRFSVCGSPSEDLSHIASLTIGCSR
jgi:hypothetical protein